MNYLYHDLQPRLWAYIAGIAKNNKMNAISVGGIENHVHLLMNLPTTLSISRAMQLLKGNSSKWLNEEFPRIRPFCWQEGYGAFSIGASQVSRTVAYIAGQHKHHRRRSFEDEFLTILKKYEIPYDPRYVFDSEIVA